MGTGSAFFVKQRRSVFVKQHRLEAGASESNQTQLSGHKTSGRRAAGGRIGLGAPSGPLASGRLSDLHNCANTSITEARLCQTSGGEQSESRRRLGGEQREGRGRAGEESRVRAEGEQGESKGRAGGGGGGGREEIGRAHV